MRGDLYNALGRYRDAIDDYDQSISLKPDNPEALLGRGFCLGAAGRLSSRHPGLRQAARAANPTTPRLSPCAARRSSGLSDNEGAIADFTAAMKITPQEVYLYLARSAALVKLDRHAEALQDREQAVKLAPNSAEVYLARGGSYHQLGQHEKGLADRSKAIELDPQLPEAWFARGSAYYLLGDYAKAQSDLAQALRLRPDYKEAAEVFARAQKRLEEAKNAPPPAPAAAAPVIAKNEPPPPPQPVPAPAAPPQLKSPEPVQSAEPAKTALPAGTAQQHEARGRAFIQSEKFPEALAELTQAIQLNPNVIPCL